MIGQSDRLPKWLKVKAPGGRSYIELKNRFSEGQLHTVCEEARCPNICDCWDRKTATFMILGDVCTRACAYCAVTSGRPMTLDLQEPIRLADTIENMGLEYVVITSVDRDDLPDGGAFMFSRSISEIRSRMPLCRIEVLIPDFGGDIKSLRNVMDARPDTLNHNIETVRRIFGRVRPKGDYDRSIELLASAKNICPEGITKSGMMVGLGESYDEIADTMRDLRSVNCDLLTIGQYLRPSRKHVAMDRWYLPDEFESLKLLGESMGFAHVASGPLVRSSYHADEQHAAAFSSG